MKIYRFLLFLSLNIFSQVTESKVARILNIKNEPLKNVLVINNECKVIDKSDNNGVFRYTENITELTFVKKGMEKVKLENDNKTLTVILKKSKPDKITNFLGAYPTRNTQVNGIALNLMTDFEDGTERSTQTNGIEIDVDPFSAMLTFVGYLHIFEKEIHQEPFLCSVDYKLVKKINGLNFNILSLKPMITNGIYFGTSIGLKNITNGIACSVLTNRNTKTNGISMSIFGNHDVTCNGIQIGLFNSSSNLRGIQLGLWNKNEKRQLPFINWNFN